MKFKKAVILLFVMFLALVLVACGGNGANSGDENSKSDPLVPVSIALKVKVAKVQINTELKMTYTITPATAQNDDVKVTIDKTDLATAAKSGNNQISAFLILLLPREQQYRSTMKRPILSYLILDEPQIWLFNVLRQICEHNKRRHLRIRQL